MCKNIIEADSGKTFDNISWPLDVSCAFRRHNETKKEINKEIWKKNVWNPWKEVIFKINTVTAFLNNFSPTCSTDKFPMLKVKKGAVHKLPIFFSNLN